MIEIERVETIYSQGTAEYREDAIISSWPFFGVIDGFSAPYSPSHPPALFGRLTGGQMVVRIISNTFSSVSPDMPLGEIILQANRAIKKFQALKEATPQLNSGLLAGASFALIKVTDLKIDVVQGGDCFALWVYKSGKRGITQNQHFQHEMKLRGIIAGLMEEVQGDRKKMWEKFYPILCVHRKRVENRDYAVLNGQARVKNCWQEITPVPVAGLDFLLLFTDGLIPYEESENEEGLAKKVAALYRKEGFGGVLSWTRKKEKATAEKSHIVQTEAAAIAIKFK